MAAHSKNAIDILYSGQLDQGDGDETVDLFGGSRLRRWLSWLPGGNVRAVHLIISGKVQRVFYRRWLQREAREKGLAGWVRNRFDGTVEAVVKGRAFDLEDLVRLAWSGPPRARVSSIEVNLYREAVGRGFKILKSAERGGSDDGKT
ncbi:MAG TPA: acylphosphatase [Firmicutes bacterium]|nr:acylphosphatase [Bacillota bacterium]